MKVIEPGGIKTDFGGRSFDFSNEPALPEYQPVVDAVLGGLGPMMEQGADPEAVAGVVFDARKLTMSRRTLQRRIEAEGTSYQQILDTTRHDLAAHYLENTALSIAEIAFLLGFREPNSLYRAFRGWTGTTPDHVRRAR